MTIFRVRQHDPKPFSWWLQQSLEGRLDMHPVYQRRSDLWSHWKRAHLIDSIVNEFDIPKFYVADFTAAKSKLNIKKKPYAIIDGRQRFEAVFDFLQDKFPLNESTSLISDATARIRGLKYSQLLAQHPKLAARLEGYAPIVMSVETDNDEMIQQMFIRLNSGEAVNSAERRNALPGPIPGILRNLIVHPFFQQKIRFNIKRMADFNLAAKLLIAEYNETFVDTKARNLDLFVEAAWRETKDFKLPKGAKKLEKALKPYLVAEQRVLETLEKMAAIFVDRDPLLAAQGHIPVYYWVVRNHPNVGAAFRTFLEKFTTQVRENLQLSRKDPDAANAELSTYYTHGRTTNDNASLKGRYEILIKRLGKPK